MYGYNDYFDIKKREVPYRGASEELGDYLRLLDMVLESYLEYKGIDKEDKLFSRGLVITESEMRSYFEMPPYFRERDVCDPVLAAAADNAFAFIENRVARTLDPLGAAEPETVLSDLDDDELPEDGVGESEPNPFAADDELWEADREDTGEEPETGILWIESLKNIFGLDRTGVMAVILALASALDRRYDRIFGFLQDDISRTRPTVGLLNALMARITPRNGAEDLPAGALDEGLFSSLFVGGDEEKGLETPLILNPLLKRIMTGLPDLEELLPEALSIYREETDIPLFFEQSVEEMADALSDLQNAFCYFECEDEDTVLHLMFKYAKALEVPLFVLDLQQLLRQGTRERSACLAELSLRMRLAGGLLAVRLERGETGESGLDKELSEKRWKLLNRISKACGYNCIAIFGEAREPGELIVKTVPFLHIPAPDVDVRTEIWSYFLEEDNPYGLAETVVIPDLADCYNISYGMIKNTCSHVKAAARIRRLTEIDREMILESLRQLNQVDFSGLASYVRAAYTWEDIKLTEDQKNVLKVACDRYRLRNRVGQGWGLNTRSAYGNGVSLLLYGPPGTGKTMAAQVVANELGIPLYRVDISQIFSKYIGETEKNLSIIFEAAKGSNVILFFDEADALFSKRTEINNSNDKYANSETAFLLQKIEEYDGMSILATNLYTNFDTAFVRRITYSVRLDSPDKNARYVLWTTTLPKEARLEEKLPFRYLADHFELAGANIKAILYSAAYMAGAEGRAISMEHIVRAMEYEYRKLGRYIDRDAFGPYAKYLSVTGKNDTDKHEAIK